MARMLRRNLKTGLCGCLDCGMGDFRGRAAEKREWRAEVAIELGGDALIGSNGVELCGCGCGRRV